jgi:multidrug efflux pump subunit AcrB
VADEIAATGNRTPGLTGLFNSSRVDTPWLYLEIDRTKCMALGVQVSDVFNALQVYLGSFYVNNFNEFGRTWQVNIQADKQFRNQVHNIREIQIRNGQGQMIQLGTLMDVRDTSGPVMVMRYNLYSATAIFGNTAPGVSSGRAIGLVQEIADRTLPSSMASDWTELTYLQLQAGNAAIYVFALGVVFVFLVLAAQYESWSLPLAVILVVPMCLLCSVTGAVWTGTEVNIFTQIGFVVLVGLAAKNAILIVEFAKQQREQGHPARESALNASRLRLRPILMTSLAFIFGVLPLVFAHGAGAEMRQTLGIAVFSGMLGVTFFGIFLTPLFFTVIQSLGDRKRDQGAPQP